MNIEKELQEILDSIITMSKLTETRMTVTTTIDDTKHPIEFEMIDYNFYLKDTEIKINFIFNNNELSYVISELIGLMTDEEPFVMRNIGWDSSYKRNNHKDVLALAQKWMFEPKQVIKGGD